jgi:hypothetical protein
LTQSERDNPLFSLPTPRRSEKFAASQHGLCSASLASSCYASQQGMGESVVSERVFPYIAAIGIGIAAASALSFFSLVLASGIRFGLMH